MFMIQDRTAFPTIIDFLTSRPDPDSEPDPAAATHHVCVAISADSVTQKS